jgi:ankyrin repeat protein
MEIRDGLHKEIFEAFRKGTWNTEIRRKVLEMGHRINEGDKNGLTALHVASMNGHKEIMEELVKLEYIDFGVLDSFGRSVLHVAILGHKATKYPVASYSGNIYYEEENQAYLNDCVPNMRKVLDVIDILISHDEIDANLLLDKMGPLYLAVSTGHLEILERLLEANEISGEGIDVAAVEAVLKDDVQALVRLNESKHIINFNMIAVKEFSLLGLAINRNKVECLQFLLDHPLVDVKFMGRNELGTVNPFMVCLAKRNETEELRLADEGTLNVLLEHNRLNINEVCQVTYETPIHRAVMLENPFFCQKLLAHPMIDVNIRCQGIYAPLMLAAMARNEVQFEMLLRCVKTKLVNQAGEKIRPVVFNVIEYGSPSMVRKFLAAGGNANEIGWSEPMKMYLNPYEYNLLQLPVSGKKDVNERLEIGEILLEAGARPTIRDSVLGHLRQEPMKKKKRKVMESLVERRNTVPSLMVNARASIQACAREVTGDRVTFHLLEDLCKTENLPIPVKKFVLHNAAMKMVLRNEQ